MLLKYYPPEKKTKLFHAKQQRTAAVKVNTGAPAIPRMSKKTIRTIANKRAVMQQDYLEREHLSIVDPCDNSNDSGLGFDHHMEYQIKSQSKLKFEDHQRPHAEHLPLKRKKLDFKYDSEDASANYSFSGTVRNFKQNIPPTIEVIPSNGVTNTKPASLQRTATLTQRSQQSRSVSRTSNLPPRQLGPVTLSSQLMSVSQDGKTQLQILCQPEQQHRARYQTEGSRGAVKDRTGNGFPSVKLVGYNKPATLQIFIGTDVGRVTPHMFYQACRVSGKNSTPCVEKKLDGTVVIEVDFEPAKDMVVTCDCVGILKERNVDVEHRFPEQSGSRNKKKSTRCRMVFRTTITNSDGSLEVLQVTSQQIVCTQPPGIPEICKKSLSSYPCTGGGELFILGKNFLKDTKVVFQFSNPETVWEETVLPEKEFLQQTHLVCMVPPYKHIDICTPVTVRLLVISSGKTSEPHTFVYTPAVPALASGVQSPVGTQDVTQGTLAVALHGHPQGVVKPEQVFTSAAASTSNVVLQTTALSSPNTNSLVRDFKNQIVTVDVSGNGDKTDSPASIIWQETASLLCKSNGKKSENKQNIPTGRATVPPLLPIPNIRTQGNIKLISDPNSYLTRTNIDLIDESSQHNQLSPEDLKGVDLRMKSTIHTIVPLSTIVGLSNSTQQSLEQCHQYVSKPSDSPDLSTQNVEKYIAYQLDGSFSPRDDDVRNSGSEINQSSIIDASNSSFSNRREEDKSDEVLSSTQSYQNMNFETVQFSEPFATQRGPQMHGEQVKCEPSPHQKGFTESSSSGSSVLSVNSPLLDIAESLLKENPISGSEFDSLPKFSQQTEMLQDPNTTHLFGQTPANTVLINAIQSENNLLGNSVEKSMDSDNLVNQGTSTPNNVREPTALSSEAIDKLKCPDNMIPITSSSSDFVINKPDSSSINRLFNDDQIKQDKIGAPENNMPIVTSIEHSPMQEDGPLLHLANTVDLNNCLVGIQESSTNSNLCTPNILTVQPPTVKTESFNAASQIMQATSPTLSVETSTIMNDPPQLLTSSHSPQLSLKPNFLNSNATTNSNKSPVSIEAVLMNSSVQSDHSLLASSTRHSSSDSIKNIIINSSLDSNINLPNINCTSPIAIKNIFLESSLDNSINKTNAPTAINPIVIENSQNNSDHDSIHQVSQASVAVSVADSIQNGSSHPIIISSNHLTPFLPNPSHLHQAGNQVSPTDLSDSHLTQSDTNQRLNNPIVQSSQTALTNSLLRDCSIFSGKSSKSASNPFSSNSVVVGHDSSRIEHNFSSDNSESQVSSNKYTVASKLQSLLAGEKDSSSKNLVHLLKRFGKGQNQSLEFENNIQRRTKFSEQISIQSSSSDGNKLEQTSESVVSSAGKVMNGVSLSTSHESQPSNSSLSVTVSKGTTSGSTFSQKKCEEGMLPQELTQMSENDLLNYINPTCFDQV